MILVFGGAYQGKLSYTQERFGFTDEDVYRCRDECTALPSGRKVIYEIDQWILALVRAGNDVAAEVRQLIDDNPDAVIVCNDISCGIVPMGADMRKWREAVGRSMAVIAGSSDEVIRLFCGIPQQVK
jgi:adenosyl cobinamide kinase/adenosyl cobinamide phosphate guanylyltransferase